MAAAPSFANTKSRKHPVNWRDGTFRTLYLAASGRRFMMVHGFRKSRRRLSLKKPKLDTLQRLAYAIG